MGRDKLFTTILTGLGIALGIVVLGAVVVTLLGLRGKKKEDRNYPCPAAQEARQGQNYTVSFASAPARPNLTLAFSLPAGSALCRVNVGDATQFRSWKVMAEGDLAAGATADDYTLTILREPLSEAPQSRRESHRRRLENKKGGSETIDDFSHQGYPGLSFAYEQDGQRLRQYQLFPSETFTILIVSAPDDPAALELVKTLKITHQP